MESKLSRWCNGIMEAGWLAAVITTPLFFNIHSDRVFEPDKLTLLRSIALIMVAAWIVRFIDQKQWENWDWLRWKNANSVWRMPFVLPIFLLVIIYLLSTLTSVTPRVSLVGSYQRLQGTYTTLSYLAIFAIAVSTMRTRAQIRRVVTAVIISSIPVAFYGMLQHFALDPLPWGGDTQQRIAGHMGNAIFVAAYLIMVVPLTLARIIDAFTSILSDEELAYADVIRSSIYIFTLAIQLIAIYWTQSRGPWLGLMIGLFAFVLIVLIALRNATSGQGKFTAVEILKAIGLIAIGGGVAFVAISALLNAITQTGRLASLAGSMSSFVAFVAAVALLVLIIFVMLAAQRGWRWLWLSWLLLALLIAGWLAAFNFADSLEDRFADSALAPVAETLNSWQELPAIGRLGQLLNSESRTGKVRVLIWEGALELIAPHEPLAYPDGKEDKFNVLRPLLGYGPESMYVAYNRFYPPELATVEARNASPDRSHNETFDALVITGWSGFLVWQVLYLSVFYYAFSWLGVVHSRRDSYILIGLWIVGAIGMAIALIPIMGSEFLGVAIPFGSIVGLILYLIYYALFTRDPQSNLGADDPFQIDRLLMIGLVTAILAHYIEIHFGIAIAATRTHFFVYLALMFMLGYRLPQLQTQTSEEPVRTRHRRRQVDESQGGIWPSLFIHIFIVGLILGILGYEFMTYSLPPDKVIESVGDLTTAEIFLQSLLVNPSQDFVDSPFIYVMIILTWGLGTLISLSEMVKNRELQLTAVADDGIPRRRRQFAVAGFMVMAFASLAFRFLPAEPEIISATTLLGQSLLFLWALLCLWVSIRLGSQLLWSQNETAKGRDGGVESQSSARFLAGAVALTGLLLAFPILIAGGGWYGILTAVFCATLLYLLWAPDLQKILVPVGVLGFTSLAIGLFYGFIQASLLHNTILFRPNVTVTSIVELRVLEAMQSTSFLTVFYIFVFAMMFMAAFALSGGGSRSRSRKSDVGSAAGYGVLVVAFIVAFYLIGQTNLQVIHADVVYKRAKPFDAQASSSRNPEDWDIAIAIYEKALELVPNEDFYDLFLGRAYLERSTISESPAEQITLLEEAETRLVKAQGVNPLNTDHTANLARLNTRWLQLVANETEQQERLEMAEGYYKDAMALSPQNSIIRNEYARLAYDFKRDCDQALRLYDDAVVIDPYYEISFFGRAEVYIACAAEQPEAEQTSYYETAVASLQDGLALAPNNVRAWLQLSQLHQQLEQHDAALAAIEQTRNYNNGEIPTWNIDYLAALSYQGLDQTDQAIDFAQQALFAAPQNVAPQIQQLLSELTGEPITEFELSTPPELTTTEGERPLAELPPDIRNGIFTQPPPFVINPANTYEAVLVTDKGDIRVALFADAAPLTVNNFVFLAQQGFYDKTTFHRVLDNFMAQAGDPSGTGAGGPGYQFQDETNNGLTFDRSGLLAMANAGPNTNGSQFFITFEPTPWLDGGHTIFGELISGQEVLASLTRRDPAANPDFVGDVIERIDIIESTP